MNPKPPEPDASAQAQMANVQLQAKVHQDKMQLEATKLQLEVKKLQQKDQELSISALTARSEAESRSTESEVQIFEAEVNAKQAGVETTIQARRLQSDAALAAQSQEFEQALATVDSIRKSVEVQHKAAESKSASELKVLKAELARVKSDLAKAKATPAKGTSKSDLAGLMLVRRLDDINDRLNTPTKQTTKAKPQKQPIKINRDSGGRVTSVNGMPVTRDDSGLIVGIGN
jgi:hypothetical protein